VYIQRNLTPKLKLLIDKFPVLSLTGPRQSGKSSLLKNEFPDFNYVNLEDPELRQFALSDPRGFVRDNGKRLIIDEVQYASDLFSYIQLEVDANATSRYILSGSQNFLMNDKINQSLAGRVAITHLLPFSMNEVSNAELTNTDQFATIFNGFYPRLITQNIAPTDFYPSYIQTYVERDIRTLSNIVNIDLFESFVRLCAGRAGQIINYTSISNDLGISLNTVKNWLSILKTSFIAFELKPYYQNFNKRITKTGKLYFYDTGLLCSLLGLDKAQQYQTHYLKGGIFENFVIAECKKQFFHRGIKPNFYFWQNSHKLEVDLIVEKNQSAMVFEIKSGQTPHKNFGKNLVKWKEMANVENNSVKVIYGGDTQLTMYGIEYVPWNKINNLFVHDKL